MIFADVTSDMTILKDKIFEPVLYISPLNSKKEANALATDTPYGLTNYIQTSGKIRARRMARWLRSGMVEMNGNFGSSLGAPLGGMMQSGNGHKGGFWNLEKFLGVKIASDWE